MNAVAAQLHMLVGTLRLGARYRDDAMGEIFRAGIVNRPPPMEAAVAHLRLDQRARGENGKHRGAGAAHLEPAPPAVRPNNERQEDEEDD